MEQIGIRELRQNASRYLERVAGGESIEVTEHGKPVARLVPLPEATGLEALVASGHARPAIGHPRDLPPPIPLPPGSMTASEALEVLRADER